MPSELMTLLEEVADEALEDCMDEALDLIESQLDQFGNAYGNDELSRGERIARVVDMAQRGVMDILETISPPTFEMLHAQFVKDVAASPLETR